jgi:hypothetical protein
MDKINNLMRVNRMNAIMMDTLKYTKQFEDAGFQRNQAEVIVTTIEKILHQQDTTGFATKSDINDLKQANKDLNNKIDLLSSLTSQKLDSLADKMLVRVLLAGGAITTLYKIIELWIGK